MKKINLNLKINFWITGILILMSSQTLLSQLTTVTVRFANPTFDCQTSEYCVDVEYQADQPDEILYGMNVRFFYDDEVLEFIDYRDFQGGYAAYFPNPPIISTGDSTSGMNLFGMPSGHGAEFVNGAIILDDPNQPDIILPTSGWVKLYSMCFSVVDTMPDVMNFCPSLIWDLEEDPSLGGFLAGDDGVVILLVDETGMQISKAADEMVDQFNWEYDGVPGLPFGNPNETNCISIETSIQLAISFTDNDVCGGSNGQIDVCGLDPGVYYELTYTRNTIPQSTIAGNADIAGCLYITGLDAATYDDIVVTDTASGCAGVDVGGPYIVTDPGGPVISGITPNNPTSCGGVDGSIEICGLNTGATFDVNYTRNLLPFMVSLVADIGGCVQISGLDAASYDGIQILEVLTGCTTIDNGGPYVLMDPGGPTLGSIVSNDPTTCGGVDGSIEICGLSIGASYSVVYNRNGVPQSTVNDNADGLGCIQITGLNAATYTGIVVTDDLSGCSTLDSGGPYVLSDPGGTTLIITANDPLSCGGADGSVSVCGLVASTSYDIDYSRNGIPQSTFSGISDVSGCLDVTGLDEATYTSFSATNNSTGCTSQDNGSYFLTDPNGPVLGLITPTNPSSCGASNGQIQICGLNASSSYTIDYLRNGISAPSIVTVSDGSGCVVITSLDAASYSQIQITDNGTSCSTTDVGGPYILMDPNGPIISGIIGTSPSTCGGFDGQIEICGLTSGVTYNTLYTFDGILQPVFIDNADISGCIQITGLSEGSYDNIQVTDNSSGCTTTDNGGPYILVDPSGPTLTLGTVVNPSTCQAVDGSIQICGVLPGLSFSLDYSINGSPVPTSAVTSDGSGCVNISNLGAGVYSNFSLLNLSSGCTSNLVGPVTLDDGCLGSIVGDFVWSDLNGNGIQDFGEPGIENIQVSLYQIGIGLVGQTFSDANGYYQFPSVPTGDYYLQFDFDVSIYTVSPANVGLDDQVDSDVDNSFGPNTTGTISVAGGVPAANWDLGLFECIQVGDFVWFDLNANGVQDGFENGINGVRIFLYNDEDSLISQAVSRPNPYSASGDGYFKFCVAPGTYYLIFERPGFLAASEEYVGSNPEKDSDVTHNVSMYSTSYFTVSSGDMKCDIDAGFHAKASMGDIVWHDENANGIQDAQESRMAGVVVSAYDDNGRMFWQDISNASGQFYIDGLSTGDYYLKFDPPGGFTFTWPDAGDEEMDSDVNDANGPRTTALYRVSPGEHQPNVDAGLVAGLLPVEILTFDAKMVGNRVELQWETGSEFNCNYFEVERKLSSDLAFVKIGHVSSKGNSNAGHDYVHYDSDVSKSGIYYYRIRQVDYDGNEIMSDVKAVEVGAQEIVYSIYPNPTADDLNVVIYQLDDETVELEIFDASGKLVEGTAIESKVDGERKQFKANVRFLSTGVYNIRIKVGDRIVNRRFTKVE